MVDKYSKNKFEGKVGKYCPFREGHKCGGYCGLWCVGLKACVFHGINAQLQNLTKRLK